MIIKNTEKVNKIISLLLNNTMFSDSNMRNSNVHQVIDRAISIFSDNYLKKSVKIKKNYNRNLPVIMMDEKIMLEAFFNLLNNSIEAMPDGGLITISSKQITKGIILIFDDTGIGIDKKDFDKVFEPFFTTKEDNIGLGLFLTNQIIEFHKGWITIENKVSEGVSVSIMLPTGSENNG
jgi:two-component system, NtrC family, sensor kinase